MASVPEIREEPVEEARYRTDKLIRPLIELRRLYNLLSYLLPTPIFVEDFVRAMKERTVHIALLEKLVDIEDGIGPLRFPVDPFQDLEVRLDGVSGKKFEKEASVAVVTCLPRRPGSERPESSPRECGIGNAPRRRNGRKAFRGSSRRGREGPSPL
jgi:hypothetical protein